MNNDDRFKSSFYGIFGGLISFFALAAALSGAFFFPSGAFAAGFPLLSNDGLSATFCEFRRGHLHAGCDFRTKRKTGIPVVSPVNGIISSLHGDENGYGLMLTVRASDNSEHSFAHLSAFENGKLGLSDIVEGWRASANARFPFDIQVSTREISVKKGQIIAYSGDTGAGPPHLHYEISSEKGVFINPLGTIGRDDTIDPTPPEIVSAIIVPRNPAARIDGLPFAKAVRFEKGRDTAALNAVGDLVVIVRAFDENGFDAKNDSRMGLYRITLKAGGGPVYSMRFDSMSPASMRDPGFVYDMYRSEVSGGEFYYNMFNSSGRPAPGFVEAERSRGVISSVAGGYVKLTIEAEDFHGNVAVRNIVIAGDPSPSAVAAPSARERAALESGALLRSAGNKKKARAAGNVKTRKGSGSARPSSAASPKREAAASAGRIKVVPAYHENGISILVTGLSEGETASVWLSSGKDPAVALPAFHVASGVSFFAAYGPASAPGAAYRLEVSAAAVVSAPGGTVPEKQGTTGSVRSLSFELPVSEVVPGAWAEAPGGSASIFVESHADGAGKLYAGSAVPRFIAPSAGASNADSSFDVRTAGEGPEIRFSATVLSGRVRMDLPPVPSGRECVYFSNGKTLSFAGCDASTAPDGKRSISAGFRYVRSVSPRVAADAAPPVLKPSKRTNQMFSKPFRPSKDRAATLVSFTLTDSGSGVSRGAIEYKIDGRPCGNFEYFSGSLLNCYLGWPGPSGALAPGEHELSVIARDRAGNAVTFERRIRIQK